MNKNNSYPSISVGDYDYHLPDELIAHAPAEPRDSSRLLVYSSATDEIILSSFAEISKFLPERSVVVLNNTKVVPARMELKKLTGGSVRILFLLNEWDGKGDIKGLPDRKVNVGEDLFLNGRPFVRAKSQKNEEFVFSISVPIGGFKSMLDAFGRTPLPPYIHSDMPESELRSRYQTVFSDQPASVAAPTASLHFTEKVFSSLSAKGIETIPVTLHVGRGTFSPVDAAALVSGSLHEEPIYISNESAAAISRAKLDGRKIIAAGTTSIRILESTADTTLAGKGYQGHTSLFIKPPYDFRVVDALITNFHLPKTSLLMLVDSFMRYKGARRSWRSLYELAVKERMRFYSFGDAMLIL